MVDVERQAATGVPASSPRGRLLLVLIAGAACWRRSDDTGFAPHAARRRRLRRLRLRAAGVRDRRRATRARSTATSVRVCQYTGGHTERLVRRPRLAPDRRLRPSACTSRCRTRSYTLLVRRLRDSDAVRACATVHPAGVRLVLAATRSCAADSFSAIGQRRPVPRRRADARRSSARRECLHADVGDHEHDAVSTQRVRPLVASDRRTAVGSRRSWTHRRRRRAAHRAQSRARAARSRSPRAASAGRPRSPASPPAATGSGPNAAIHAGGRRRSTTSCTTTDRATRSHESDDVAGLGRRARWRPTRPPTTA